MVNQPGGSTPGVRQVRHPTDAISTAMDSHEQHQSRSVHYKAANEGTFGVCHRPTGSPPAVGIMGKRWRWRGE